MASKTTSRIRRALRGEVDARTAIAEARRRIDVWQSRRRERNQLAELDRQPARLGKEFAPLTPQQLLDHFRSRQSPQFFPGITDLKRTAELQRELFPGQTAHLTAAAERIVSDHCWPLLGFGEKCFGGEINWNRDPLSQIEWPLHFHADINLFRNDGSDARVLWELNRLGHFITLGRAYAITQDERFSSEFLAQLGSWRAQNPVGCGANWNCAMEVALRAMNLLAALPLFLPSPQMTGDALAELLRVFDQHGAHIRRNLEFSHIATSNHYLCDVAGLLWLGILVPELNKADEWREFGLRELLNEMDKQILNDGADSEASTGYHRLKVELFLYSFALCRSNSIEIPEKHWQKLRAMLRYVAAYLRPDGFAPLVGDSDSGQVLPIVKRAANDHAYVLAIGAALLKASEFKLTERFPEELLWLLGEQGVRDYQELTAAQAAQSRVFPDAGTVILREQDLYLFFNISGSGLQGRGSHGHNDLLSVEVSARGTTFIVDPGTYVYTAELHERHRFRSTAYHSTVEVDETEQNSIAISVPFVIADEGQPRLIDWQTGADDLVIAEHFGYRRLAQPVTHRRAIHFAKRLRCWFIEDTLSGEGVHQLAFRFQIAPGLVSLLRPDGLVDISDKMTNARMVISASGLDAEPEFEEHFCSVDYGKKTSSRAVIWQQRSELPVIVRFSLIVVDASEDVAQRVSEVKQGEKVGDSRAPF